MLPHQSNNLIRGKRESVGMDSYVGPCLAPYLPLLPLPCTLIRVEETPIALMASEIEGGGHETVALSKRPAYIFHGTLRMSCLSSADNSLGTLWRRGGERQGGGESRQAFVICICISAFSFRFLSQALSAAFSLKASKTMHCTSMFSWGACGKPFTLSSTRKDGSAVWPKPLTGTN